MQWKQTRPTAASTSRTAWRSWWSTTPGTRPWFTSWAGGGYSCWGSSGSSGFISLENCPDLCKPLCCCCLPCNHRSNGHGLLKKFIYSASRIYLYYHNTIFITSKYWNNVKKYFVLIWKNSLFSVAERIKWMQLAKSRRIFFICNIWLY